MAVAGKVAITLSTENGGAWSADVTYDRLVAVKHNNNLYISRKTVANVEPPNDEFWFLALEGFGGDDVESILQAIDNIIDGTTQVGNAKTLDGHGAEDFLSRTGGILDGPLEITENGNAELSKTRVITAVGGTSFLVNVNPDPAKMRRIAIQPISSKADPLNALEYHYTDDGVIWGVHTVLHTGNKPTGTYTGNGDATARQIATGGIGNELIIEAGEEIGIVGYHCGVIFNAGLKQAFYFTAEELNFRNGILTIATDSVYVNVNGGVYGYRVL